jgi:excisionase family DNA binding protein
MDLLGQNISISQVTKEEVELLTQGRAAKVLKVSIKFVQDLIRKGEIEVIYNGNRPLIPLWELKLWQIEKLKESQNLVKRITDDIGKRKVSTHF